MARDGQHAASERRDRLLAFSFAGADLLIEVADNDHIVDAFGSAMPLIGRDADALVGRSVFELFLPASEAQISAALAEMRAGSRVRFAPAQGRAGLRGVPVLVSGHGVPEHRTIFLAISRAAGHGLVRAYAGRVGRSGLLDRAGLEALARELVEEPTPLGGVFGLALLDIPEFKDIGERLGIEAMESFLEGVERTLREVSVGHDSAALLGHGRYGLIHGFEETPESIRGRVIALKNLVDPDNQVETRTVSVDLCLDCGDVASQEAVAALVQTIEMFARGEVDPKMPTGIQARLSDTVTAMSAFKDLVREGSFHLAYHPIVDLRTDGVHHFECLVRFEGAPETSPFGIVRFAEDVGIIGGLDLAVMRGAVASLREGPARNEAIRLAINISGRSFADPEIVRQLCSAVNDISDLHGRLLFEITESAEIANLQAADAVIQDWRCRGHAVCLDDFGAGAAAFHYLRALTVDYVKIDGSYVKDLRHSPKSVPFLRAIVQLCGDLKMDAIAEFVDSEETASLLAELGVRYGQGFLFGRPMRPKEDGPLPDDWWEADSSLVWRNGRLYAVRAR